LTILGKHGRPNGGYHSVAVRRADCRMSTGKETVMSIDNDVDRDIIE